MKLLKLSMLTLFVAIIGNLLLANAASSTVFGSITVLATIEAGVKTNYTDYHTKTDWGSQTYYNENTYTPLTDPCTKCKIISILQTEGGDSYGSVLTSMGGTATFSESLANSPGSYRLQIYRYDSTLLTTYSWAVWTINPTL